MPHAAAALALFVPLVLAPPARGQCERAILAPSDPDVLDVFGWSVDLDGDRAVLGAIGGDDACPANAACNSGAAYVFERAGASWSEIVKLNASDHTIGDEFGQDVAVDGDRIAVGAHKAGPGAVYVFHWDGLAWTEEQKLVGSGALANFHFGHALALEGDTLAIGTMRDNHAGVEAGSAYVFVRTGGIWVERVKLVASDAAGGDRYGRAIDMDGDVIVVGAHLHDEVGADSGTAYVYERDDAGTPLDPTDDTWPEVAKLVPSDAAAGAFFARGVGVFEDTIVVGASLAQEGGLATGAAYVFERVGGSWSEVQRLVASDGDDDDRFGISVAIDGGRVLIGAKHDDDAGMDAGAAYLFRRTPTGWIETAKILASDGAAGDTLGEEVTVAVSGHEALLAAMFSDAHAANGGSGYVVDLDGCFGATFCNAFDGALTACPCGNAGSPGSGCDIPQGTGGVVLEVLAQTTAPNGATLQGTGFPSMAAPTALVLRSTALDPSSPVPFGDGLRCVGTLPLVRLAATTASGGTSLHVFGHGAMAGAGTFVYQIWFRSTPSTYCVPDLSFNLSSGHTLTW